MDAILTDAPETTFNIVQSLLNRSNIAMNNDSNPSKLQELLKELDDLHSTGVVTKDEHECLRFILNHAYSDENVNNASQSLSVISNVN